MCQCCIIIYKICTTSNGKTAATYVVTKHTLKNKGEKKGGDKKRKDGRVKKRSGKNAQIDPQLSDSVDEYRFHYC